jgi:hypothetical protein
MRLASSLVASFLALASVCPAGGASIGAFNQVSWSGESNGVGIGSFFSGELSGTVPFYIERELAPGTYVFTYYSLGLADSRDEGIRRTESSASTMSVYFDENISQGFPFDASLELGGRNNSIVPGSGTVDDAVERRSTADQGDVLLRASVGRDNLGAAWSAGAELIADTLVPGSGASVKVMEFESYARAVAEPAAGNPLRPLALFEVRLDYSFEVFFPTTIILDGIFHTRITEGDLDLDSVVGVADLDTLAAQWQLAGSGFRSGDVNLDGVVNSSDLGYLEANWAPGPGGPSFEDALAAHPELVPEPAGVALVGATALLLNLRRPRRRLAGRERAT